MILFFDTETTGVPKNYKAKLTDLDNWPRIIQLAWAFYDGAGNLIESSCDLIKPEGWVMPTDKFWIDNGFSQYESEKRGIPILEALKKLIDKINISKVMVAHNMSFDLPIVYAEMIRAQIKALNSPEKFCTMRVSTDLCQIPGPHGYKWPKLEELHKFLFKEGFEGAHDALNDVMATAKCYFKLIEMNYVPTPKKQKLELDIPSAEEL